MTSTTIVSTPEQASSTVKKSAPSKAESYLIALGKVRDPKSDDAKSILTHVGEFVANDATVKAAGKEVESLTAALKASRESHDGLITYRNRAVRTALRVGFGLREVSREFGISVGTVTNLRDAGTLRASLKAGGNANPPSEESLLKHISGASAAERQALISAAKETGEVKTPESTPAAPKPVTVASVLAKAESLADAVASLGDTVSEADRESLERLVAACAKAARKAGNIRVRRPAPTPKDVAPRSETSAAA